MRSATYHDGVITLDRPVKEMFGPIYQRLYTVAFEGTEHLQPSANVAEFEVQAPSRLDNGVVTDLALSRWRGPFGDE